MSQMQQMEYNLQTHIFKSGIQIFNSPEGYQMGWGTTVGAGFEGWAPGAIFNDGNASAGQQRWVNEGSKTAASWKRQEAGSLAMLADETITWPNDAVFTAKLFGGGTSANPLTTSTADVKFIEFRCESTASSGDNRLLYMRYALGGAGGGETLRALTKVEANLGTAHGAHLSLGFVATAGGSECSGLGVACRGTLHIPNVASWAPTGTYAAGMFEIYSDGSSSDPAGMTELAVLRLENAGDGTGKADVDTDAYLFSIQGFATAADSTKVIRTDSLAELNTANTIGLRIKVGSTVYYIPAVTAADWN